MATYAVLGHKDAPHSTRQLQRQQQGMTLDLDLNQIDKSAAVAQLQAVIDELQNRS